MICSCPAKPFPAPTVALGSFQVTDTLELGTPTGTWQFEIGMTWEQFVNSKYNNPNMGLDLDEYGNYYWPNDYGAILAHKDEKIRNGGIYEMSI